MFTFFTPSSRQFEPERKLHPLRIAVLLLLLAALALAEPTPQFPQPVREGEAFLDWSQTGQRILAQDDEHLWVHDLETMKTQAFSIRRLYTAELDPQDQLLAIASYPCAVQVHDWRRGQRLWEFQGPKGPEEGSYQPSFSPDGRYLMISSASHGRSKLDPWVRIFEARSGKLVRKWNWLTSHAVQVDWTSDGAVVKADGKFLASFNVASGEKIAARAGELISLGSRVKGQPTVTYGDPLKKQHFARIQSSKLDLVEEESDSYEPALTSPDGQLVRTTEVPFQVKRQDGTVVWSGENVFHSWTDDGFAVNKEGKTEFYRSDGTLLGTVNAESLILGKSRLAYTALGYGGPVGFYDVKTYTTLLELPYATMPKLSPDESKLALLSRKGVLILDVPATLQALPAMVWWKR